MVLVRLISSNLSLPRLTVLAVINKIPFVSRIAVQCGLGRQKQSQPLAVLAGFRGGASGLKVWLLPKFCFGPSPVEKGVCQARNSRALA